MIAVALALVLAAAPANPRKDATAAAMRSAMHAIVGLQPYLASPAAFRDPANAQLITASLASLTAVEHRFAFPASKEPTLQTLGRVFGTEVARASADLAQGDSEATRRRLKSLTGICFACHSRERVAHDFDDAAKVVESMNLSPARKAEFYGTTRQFDLALAAWEQALRPAPKSELDAFEHADALRQSLAIRVRVKDDRASTRAAIERQLARTDLPGFTRRLLLRWQADAIAWQADPFDAATAAPLALLEKGRALLEASAALRSPLPDDDHFVPALRASGYLHAALAREPAAVWRGEALYLLGVASATSQDPLLWELDGLYLEACIREKPHSTIAVVCSDRLTARAYLGWTGSGGTRIPADVQATLRELRDLAQ